MVTSVNLSASPARPDPIRVLVAEGQALFRQALRSILEEQPDIAVVGEAGDIERVVSEAERTRPDVLLLAQGLSLGSLGQTASLLRACVPQCHVVVIASKEDDAALLAAVEAGVVGYITREVGIGDLLGGGRVVHRGEALIPAGMVPSLVG